jgi:hypothetical protein
MNNLTPLQEVASRIYAALIANNQEKSIKDVAWMIDIALDRADSFLEATKPEPLEWKKPNEDEIDNVMYYSKGGEFCILEYGKKFKLIKEDLGTPEEIYHIALFPTLDEAKTFTEHIRTR